MDFLECPTLAVFSHILLPRCLVRQLFWDLIDIHWAPTEYQAVCYVFGPRMPKYGLKNLQLIRNDNGPGYW